MNDILLRIGCMFDVARRIIGAMNKHGLSFFAAIDYVNREAEEELTRVRRELDDCRKTRHIG